ncbi:hypothetical protein BT93_L5405 [Corymbia citriodora subsp. variegata]|uniref:Uncharacterized protein n=1 Tax=Corymbia citriodora subsp. variegata TaxID=360336 RepID=A0A8T0CXE7_CORYI|nr:hypothetical protein BT93_L5405 [Corymbia citriodora subsp. variegata]
MPIELTDPDLALRNAPPPGSVFPTRSTIAMRKSSISTSGGTSCCSISRSAAMVMEVRPKEWRHRLLFSPSLPTILCIVSFSQPLDRASRTSKAAISAEDDLELERKLAKRLEVKDGKLHGSDDGMNI